MHPDREPAYRRPLAPGGLRNGHIAVATRFVTLQMFALIYLQKFAIGPLSFQISVPMLVMAASLCWMVVSGNIAFSPARLVCYLVFAGLCLLSQVLARGATSVSSLLQLFLLYAFMTVTVDFPESAYRKVLDRFVRLMILPACIISFQYGFQSLTGLGNPISMDRLIPSTILLQGFIYEAPYHWGFAFARPNGFFFLETSFASAFAASAAIIEMTYFRRPAMVALMLGATVLSLGGTGITLLVVALPFLLARETSRVVGLVVGSAVAALVVAHVFDLPIPLVSRLGELGQENSSGSGRLLLPAQELLDLVTDPSYIFTGTGSGSITTSAGSAWPSVKLLNEYGLLVTLSFVVFYLTCIWGDFNVPLKIALSVAFHFTGGYLLNPIMVEFLALFCIIIAPMRVAQGMPLPHTRHWLPSFSMRSYRET